jgi:hypothetical protein
MRKKSQFVKWLQRMEFCNGGQVNDWLTALEPAIEQSKLSCSYLANCPNGRGLKFMVNNDCLNVDESDPA